MAGDLDSDGYDDFVLSGTSGGDDDEGVAYVVRGPPPSELDVSKGVQRYLGSHRGSDLGTCTAPGDLTGDGLPDLVLAAPALRGGNGEGAVYVLNGPVHHPLVALAEQVLLGEEYQEGIGAHLATLGDLDGDGVGDFSVANSYKTVADGNAAYLVLDHGPGDFHPRDVGVTVHRDRSKASFAADMYVSPLGDLDGDGSLDVGFGTPWGTHYSGALRVLTGPFGFRRSIDLASERDLVFTSTDRGSESELSHAVGLGDWNGDGNDVAAIGDPWAYPLETYVFNNCHSPSHCAYGAVHLVSAPLRPGVHDLKSIADRIEGSSDDMFGAPLAGGADLNLDGFPDLLIGAPRANPPGYSEAGVATLLFGGGSP